MAQSGPLGLQRCELLTLEEEDVVAGERSGSLPTDLLAARADDLTTNARAFHDAPARFSQGRVDALGACIGFRFPRDTHARRYSMTYRRHSAGALPPSDSKARSISSPLFPK